VGIGDWIRAGCSAGWHGWEGGLYEGVVAKDPIGMGGQEGCWEDLAGMRVVEVCDMCTCYVHESGNGLGF